MVIDDSNQITNLLIVWSEGDESSLDEMMPLVYEELHRMARRYMKKQPSGHIFQTTEFIHEAYLKLADGENQHWQNRSHFLAWRPKRCVIF